MVENYYSKFRSIFTGPKQSKQSSVMRGLASSPERSIPRNSMRRWEWDTTPCGSYARVRSHPIPDPSLCSAGGDPFRTRVHPSPSLRRYRGCLSEQLGEAVFEAVPSPSPQEVCGAAGHAPTSATVAEICSTPSFIYPLHLLHLVGLAAAGNPSHSSRSLRSSLWLSPCFVYNV